MNAKEILATLKQLGKPQTAAIYKRHGAGDNVFGVLTSEIAKLQKKIKVDHALAMELWKTGNAEARVLALQVAAPEKLTGGGGSSFGNDSHHAVRETRPATANREPGPPTMKEIQMNPATKTSQTGPLSGHTVVIIGGSSGMGLATAGQVDGERSSYRERYLTAAQRLLDYEALHPDVLIGSSGSETLPPDLQGQLLEQGATPSLQPLAPALATTDVRVESQFLALQLASRLAADAYHNFEAETAKNGVAAVANAHDYGAQVVDPAVVAEPDTSARRWRLVYAAVLAGLLGAGITFGREHIERRMRLAAMQRTLIGEAAPHEVSVARQ